MELSDFPKLAAVLEEEGEVLVTFGTLFSQCGVSRAQLARLHAMGYVYVTQQMNGTLISANEAF